LGNKIIFPEQKNRYSECKVVGYVFYIQDSQSSMSAHKAVFAVDLASATYSGVIVNKNLKRQKSTISL
jgi:hypothetical protein